MRVFIAVEMPKEIKEILLDAQNQINTEKAKIKPAKAFHLTLKFLGEVEEKKIEEIKSTLNEIKFKKISTTLTEIGVFPNESYIRVVWAGLEDSEGKIKKLQQEIDSKIEKLGFKKDTRFHPHVTLARVKFVEDKQKFIKDLKEIKIEKKSFQITEFKLIKSILTLESPVYEDLAVFQA
ncbi:MAG: RNA 2',3'-cyclic phosphodiesterase [Nanoarchaeota archaeon]|nr:RNA 2',3'-cyclic phosphodiesterase [Nanoarchaeota archaeon]MBU4284247.1 RNA 2',3'-cyclic phosphodiesterase [Nanoarchaeota archaeon]MBU4493436.1 RNA 2',3'-cyclic phosphodiesterase [Nanoarchaeota archaeon]MCG2717510.1 RNA 2',3'-cyclic phosphodiesterase [Nanoarchaeota archaeon]